LKRRETDSGKTNFDPRDSGIDQRQKGEQVDDYLLITYIHDTYIRFWLEASDGFNNSPCAMGLASAFLFLF